MELSDKAEEILERLGIGIEEKGEFFSELSTVNDEAAMGELVKSGYITIEGKRVSLSPAGKKEAENAIRRHRLAERLLADVLDVKRMILNEVSCKFEHLLHKGVEDDVCILLGHPKVCPHGKPVPPGRCCREFRKSPRKLVSSLFELQAGQSGKIAYIHTGEGGQLQKLLAMGALPGSSIRLLQKFPSYVFQIGNSQFAIDREIAKDIYVRLVKV